MGLKRGVTGTRSSVSFDKVGTIYVLHILRARWQHKRQTYYLVALGEHIENNDTVY